MSKFYLEIREILDVEQIESGYVGQELRKEYDSIESCKKASPEIENLYFSNIDYIRQVHMCYHENNKSCEAIKF